MIETDVAENIDKTVWLPEGESIITKHRRDKGDIFTGEPCEHCGASGKEVGTGVICTHCRGKGRTGERNATDVDLADIRYAQVQVRNILNFLWGIEAISDDQHHDAQTFQIWREMHENSMGMRRATSSGDPEAVGVRLRAYGYVMILQRLHRNDQKLIELAITLQSTAYTRQLAVENRYRYLGAIERLSLILPPIRDQISYLENLTDDERNQLSEEKLKKFVAHIVKEV